MSRGSAPGADLRLALWRAHGASADEAAELLAYAASPIQEHPPSTRSYPLPEPPCVAAWERYAGEARASAALETLRRVLVQLRFPIAAGIGDDPAYQAAVRRGASPDASVDAGAFFVRPEGLRVFLHPTAAGRVPVVLAEAREDFETLVRAIAHRNEPVPVPASMGASTFAGYNNWERVDKLRRAYVEQHPEDPSGDGWAAAFRELLPRKELYQDRFMLLSSGPYSATPAVAVGLGEDEWRGASVKLRLEHECTHYFMRQAFGVMRKSLLDELVADYMGLVEALGSFRLDCFLLFMGLESWPPYRDGGRLQNYRGTPPLSDGAFAVLQPVVKRAAETLARLDPSRRLGPLGVAEKARVITALTRIGLEGLAHDDAEPRLEAALIEAAQTVRAADAN